MEEMLKDVRDLGLKAADFGYVWGEELDRYLEGYDKVLMLDEGDVYSAKNRYDEEVYRFKNNRYRTKEDYIELRSYLRFDIGEVDKNSNICKVYNLGDVILYNILREGIIIVVYGNVVVGYITVYSSNQLYYDLLNDSICYKHSGKQIWWGFEEVDKLKAVLY